jgi:hypothetical protein
LLGLVGVVFALAYLPAASAAAIFSNGFESGDFSAWSLVKTGGDGTAAVQSQIVSTGAVAAQFTETGSSGSKAYARKTFDAAQTDFTVSGDFYVAQQGASGGNVLLLRLFDPRSTRLISVYRKNGTSNAIGVSYGGKNFSTTGKLALGTWKTVSVHVIVAGAASTVAITLNGNSIYRTTTAHLGSAGVATVQIGNDTGAQAGSVAVDTIAVQSGGPGSGSGLAGSGARSSTSTGSPPAVTSNPVVSGTPVVGDTLTSSTGTWTNSPTSYGYRWVRCNTSGVSCTGINGYSFSSSNQYTVQSADVGFTLRSVVKACNSSGCATARSAPTAVVQGSSGSPPAVTSNPVVSGTPVVGDTLTSSTGAWTNSPTSYGYRWVRCNTSGVSCTGINGYSFSSSNQYTVQSADVGFTLRSVVKACNSSGCATARSAPTAVVQTGSGQSGLVALWHMNETSGTTMFDAVGSDNGTDYHIQLGVPGFSGTAYGFNGSSSYVSVPSADDLNPNNANVTVTIELNTTGTPPASPGDWDLIRKGTYSSSSSEYKMELQQSGEVSCGFKGTSGYTELIAGPAVNNGQWHTAQCVKTATAIEVVVDGQVFSKTASLGSISNTQPLVIGAHPGSDWYSGTLDEPSLKFG